MLKKFVASLIKSTVVNTEKILSVSADSQAMNTITTNPKVKNTSAHEHNDIAHEHNNFTHEHNNMIF